MSYRVVYGEQRPAWEKIFPTRREAREFAKKHRSLGDLIFSIKKVIPGEPPQSITAAVELDMIVTAERERCAKVAAEFYLSHAQDAPVFRLKTAGECIAAAIRKGEPGR